MKCANDKIIDIQGNLISEGDEVIFINNGDLCRGKVIKLKGKNRPIAEIQWTNYSQLLVWNISLGQRHPQFQDKPWATLRLILAK